MRYTSESGLGLCLARYGVGYVADAPPFGYAVRPDGTIDCTNDVELSYDGDCVILNGERFRPIECSPHDIDHERDEIAALADGELRLFAEVRVASLRAKEGREKLRAAVEKMAGMIREAQRNGVEVPKEAYEMAAELISLTEMGRIE